MTSGFFLRMSLFCVLRAVRRQTHCVCADAEDSCLWDNTQSRFMVLSGCSVGLELCKSLSVDTIQMNRTKTKLLPSTLTHKYWTTNCMAFSRSSDYPPGVALNAHKQTRIQLISSKCFIIKPASCGKTQSQFLWNLELWQTVSTCLQSYPHCYPPPTLTTWGWLWALKTYKRLLFKYNMVYSK